MSNKLTLTIEPSLIEKMEKYTCKHQQNLSELVSNYFKGLTAQEEQGVTKEEEEELSPIVKALKGSISLPADFDWKKDKMESLT